MRVLHSDIHLINLRTRMPFRYGIAVLTALPHAILRVEMEIDGRRQVGLAADQLAPKWFTKDPATPFRQEVEEMLEVIRAAESFAEQAGERGSVFELWAQIYQAQEQWGDERGFPPLLWNFGLSLVERAMIDAFCRAQNVPFAQALRQGRLGFSLSRLRELAPAALEPEATQVSLRDALPARPLQSVRLRHTVGLGDPLTEADIPADQRLHDGLPQSLEAAIAAYGLSRFKVKLSGEAEADRQRLRHLAELLERQRGDWRFTLDANEHFRDLEGFRGLWESLTADGALQPLLERLIFIEQPFHRDVALSPEIGRGLGQWTDRPAIIIDESDAHLGDAAAALSCGYAGTSHKNCKGVFKSLGNICLLTYRRGLDPHRAYILSGEDLSNVGPVAMLQDLAVMASLGVEHVERNGHHYYTGVSFLPPAVQEQLLRHHGDLYRRHERGYATMEVRGGMLSTRSVTDAPFGTGFNLDVDQFTAAEEWSFDSLPA